MSKSIQFTITAFIKGAALWATAYAWAWIMMHVTGSSPVRSALTVGAGFAIGEAWKQWRKHHA